jgi:hypothetical protein
MTLRTELRAVLGELLRRPEREISLDTIVEALGTRAVTADEIGELLDELESAGRSIGSEQTSARQSLVAVLGSARTLRDKLGRSPTSHEIAEHSGLSPDAVRLALLFARILQR